MKGFKSACRVKINAAGDWQIVPPAGQITQIGNAGATSRGLVANDDLFVSGKLEVDDTAYFDAGVTLQGTTSVFGTMQFLAPSGQIWRYADNSAYLRLADLSEELIIPVGQGAAGINTVVALAIANSVLDAVAVRVTQAPGGGAATFSVGRTGGNIDEFIQNIATALATVGNSAADGDGVNAGPIHNGAANTLVITTNANVTVTEMKVRIVLWYTLINAPAW
ncbi:hypothetical protein LCGC14_0829200 [marine sediment metagenome]|uniref:Major tropism determinant N-terminal domain-containing protein n=1 Tax=marine sediment metagenome TaxID=412755 RepID=A0A0F9PL79_9ZZZZ